jgi:ribosomal protein L4
VAEADSEMVCVRFDGEDLRALKALIEVEHLNRSDVVRRAVRAYAADFGIVPKPKQPKPKR